MLNQIYSLLCLFFPCAVLTFLLTGPHNSVGALTWTLALWLMVAADWLSPRISSKKSFQKFKEKSLNKPSQSTFFNGLLYALALLQFCNIGFMLVYASQLKWQSSGEIITSIVSLIVLRIMVGTSSGSSGIIVAHELIHRSSKGLQLLGRLLMCTVCYEHFVIAHKQGHHRRVAKPNDIATAKGGELYEDYCKRVYVEHWHYAWQYEKQRLAITSCPLLLKLISNRVLQGMLVEMLLVIGIIFIFGWLSAVLFLYCAYAGVRLLEAINYFQHWGLRQRAPHVLAWVNDSWVTHYALLGMSYHIEHHEHATTHYQDIGYSDQGPIMPYGYFVTNLWVKLNNRSYQEITKRELQRYTNSVSS